MTNTEEKMDTNVAGPSNAVVPERITVVSADQVNNLSMGLKKKFHISLFLAILEALSTKLGIVAYEKPKEIIHINPSNVLSGVFASVMTYLRKISGQSVKSASSEKLAGLNIYTAGFGSHEDIKKELVAQLPEIAFIDWQFCTPIVNMMSAYRLFYNESRCGVTTWLMIQRQEEGRGQKRKLEGEVVKRVAVKEKLSDYGLGPMAIPFMKGITLKPERRSGLLKYQEIY